MIIDKEIITEITRINEIMGVKPSLVLESSDPILNLLGLNKKAKKWGKDMADWFTGVGKKVTDRGIIRVNNIEVPQAFWNKIEAALQNADTFWSTMSQNVDDLKLLGRLINSDPALAKKFFDDIIENLKLAKEFKDLTNDEISLDLAIAIYKKMKDENKTLDEVLEEIFTEATPSGPKTYWELVNGLRTQMQKQIDEMPPNLKKAIDDPGNTSFTGWKELIKVWQLQANWFKGLFTSSKKTKDEILELSKNINSKIQSRKLSPGKIEEDIRNDLNKLLNLVVTLKKTGSSVTAKDFEDYILNNNLIKDSDQFKKWLKENEADINTMIENAKSGWYKSTFSEVSSSILKSYAELIPFIKFKSIADVAGESGLVWKASNIGNTIQRYKNLVLYRTPFNYSELRRVRAMQGRNAYLADKLFTILAVTPLFLSGVEYVQTWKENQTPTEAFYTCKKIYEELCGGSATLNPEQTDVIVDEKHIDNEACNGMKKYLEDLKPAEFEKGYIDFAIESIKMNFGLDFFKDIASSDFKKAITDLSIFTDADDLLLFVTRFLISQATTFEALTPEQVQELVLNYYKDQAPELEGILKDLDLNDPKALDEVIQKIKNNSPDLTAFKEPYKTVLEKYPKLKDWLRTDYVHMKFEQNDSRFTAKRFEDEMEFKAQKNEDGSWSWVSPVKTPFKDGGVDPTGEKSNYQTPKEEEPKNRSETTYTSTLTLEKAISIGICENGFNRLMKKGTWIFLNDDEVILESSKTKYFLGKGSDGVWRWWSDGDSLNKVYNGKVLGCE